MSTTQPTYLPDVKRQGQVLSPQEARTQALVDSSTYVSAEAAQRLAQIATENPDLPPDLMLAALHGDVSNDSTAMDALYTAAGVKPPVAAPPAPPAPPAREEDQHQDWSDNLLGEAVKGATRTILNTVSAPVEMVTHGLDAVAGELGLGGAETKSPGVSAGWDDYFNSLSVVQQVKHWDDQGDGWFGNGGKAAEEQEAANMDLAYKNVEITQPDGKKSIQQQPYSIGDLQADAAALALPIGWMQDGSQGYKIVKAWGNIAAYIVLDPVTYVTLGGSALLKAKNARYLKDFADAVTNSHAAEEVLKSTDDVVRAGEDVQNATEAAVNAAKTGSSFDDEAAATLDSLFKRNADSDTVISELTSLVTRHADQQAAGLQKRMEMGRQIFDSAAERHIEASRIAEQAGDWRAVDRSGDVLDSINAARKAIDEGFRPGANTIKRSVALRELALSDSKSVTREAQREAARNIMAYRRAQDAEGALTRLQEIDAKLEVRKDLLRKAADGQGVKNVERAQAQLLAHVQTLVDTRAFYGKASEIDNTIKGIDDLTTKFNDEFSLDSLKQDSASALDRAEQEVAFAEKNLDSVDAAAQVAQDTAQAQTAAISTAKDGKEALAALIENSRFASQELRQYAKESLDRLRSTTKEYTAKKAAWDYEFTRLEQVQGLQEAMTAFRNGDDSLLRAISDNLRNLSPEDALKVMFGRQYEATLKVLADTDSPTRIFRMSGRHMPMSLAKKIADAKTPEEVMTVVGKALGAREIGGPIKGYGLRANTWIYKNDTKMTRTGKAFSASIRPTLRAYEYGKRVVPWGYKLQIDDLDTLIPATDDWMNMAVSRGIRGRRKAKLTDDIATLIDGELDNIARADGLVARRTALYNAMHNVTMFTLKHRTGLDESSDTYKALDNIIGASVSKYSKQALKGADAADYAPWVKPALRGTNEIGAQDVIRSARQLSEYIQLPNVKDVQWLLRRAEAFEKHGKGKGVNVADWMESVIDHFFRTAVLAFRPAFVIRNMGEMYARMWLEGSLHDPLTQIAMTLDRKAHGRISQMLKKKFGAYDQDVLGRNFRDYGDPSEMSDLSQAEREIQAMIYRSHSAVDFGQAGQRTVGSTAFKQTPVASVVTRHGDPDLFLRGWKTQLLIRRHDPMFRDVADVVLNRQPSARIIKHAEQNPGLSGADLVVDYYFNGAGRKQLDVLREERPDSWGKWTESPESLKDLLFNHENSIARADVETLLLGGSDQKLVDAILGAGTDEKAISRVIDTSFKKMRESGRLDFPVWVNDRDMAHGARGVVRRSVDWFFDKSAVAEGAGNFAPEVRWKYWQVVKENFGMLEKSEQEALLETARASLKPLKHGTNKQTRLYRDLEAQFKSGTFGPGTRQELHDIAAHRAAKHTEQLFYDAQKRKQFWYALRLAFPFGQAWSNTLAKWGTLAATTGGAIRGYSFAKAYQQVTHDGLNYYSRDEWEKMMYDPAHRPLIFNDPQTGVPVVEIPLIGSIVGEQAAFMSIPSLNVATGSGIPLPGAGPIVNVPYTLLTDTTDVDKYLPSWVKQWVQPFPSGVPKGPIKTTVDAFLPAWGRRIISFIDPQYAADELGFQVPKAAAYIYSQHPEKYNNEAGHITPDGQARLIAEAKSMVRWHSLVRGVLQASLPGSVMYKWKLENGDKEFIQEAIAADFVTMMNENGQDFDAASKQLEDQYGPGALFTTYGSFKGADVPNTTAAMQFYRDHQYTLNQYNDVAGFLFPYDARDYSAEAARFFAAKGEREPRTVEEVVTRVNNMRYFMFRKNVEEKVARGEMTEDQAKETLKSAADTFDVQYDDRFDTGLDTQERINRLERALADPKAGLDSIHAAVLAKQYLSQRSAALKVITDSKAGTTLGIQQASGIRAQLRALGEQLSAQDAGFARLWDNVLKKEVEESNG